MIDTTSALGVCKECDPIRKAKTIYGEIEYGLQVEYRKDEKSPLNSWARTVADYAKIIAGTSFRLIVKRVPCPALHAELDFILGRIK
ncbi:MAG: hypothetical protein A2X25_04400 [Chloroflexi bacterium GWB2_49_20]|nr:MAG: hypothetical protein A2X25_04400 [Chloroflexi bacterium GWB2_49_20]OGN78620.1 MAG: hypothetical protein A2X26_12460 [Chloroflexi bacterium GWC2_49_37]OGN85722.1 MAG: hypothetical protein A2X27_00930 [Chloroflexi bacterium GWD2_49_16]HBG75052.1 hypothetical protein [Anaerolineae bacterium]HCC78078.1 hypothetical protein [Anaerolineae bacterium]